MADRDPPASYPLSVEYRSASSFLIAYSVNLSRGGLFLETEAPLPVGAPVELALAVPGSGPVAVAGQIAWRRPLGDAEGPAGVGVEVTEVGASVGALVDRLVSDFQGVAILVMASATKDRSALGRLIRSVITSANLVHAGDAALADTLITDEVDLVVVDVDGDPEGAAAAIRRARAMTRPVPVLALAGGPRQRELARAAGADELAGSPPSIEELQVAVIRALGRPLAVR